MTDQLEGSVVQRPRGVRRVLTGPVGRLVVSSLVIVVIFVGVLPGITDYSEAWRLVTDLTWREMLSLLVLAALNIWSYALVSTAAMPGLGTSQAVRTEQASTAVANTVPVGFAFGVGTAAVMYGSYGFTPEAITRYVVLTGICNTLVKLGLPVIALVALAMTGDPSSGLAAATATGVALFVLLIGLIVLALTRETAAASLAGHAERVAGAFCRTIKRRPPAGWSMPPKGSAGTH